MNGQPLMSSEDTEKFKETNGQHLDNLGVEVAREKFKTGLTVSVWNKPDSFVAHVGADFTNTINAEGKTYMESVENLLKKLGV